MGGGGKGLGWISKGFRCHLSLHRDFASRTATIKDLHYSNREEERAARKTQREKQKKAKQREKRQAINRSSHACLPKRTTRLAWEGGGESMHGQKAGWVGAGLGANASFPLTTLAGFFLRLNRKVSRLYTSKKNGTLCCILCQPPTHLIITQYILQYHE